MAMGSADFAALSILLMFMANGLLVVATWALAAAMGDSVVADMRPGLWYTEICVIGISGLLFAYKVGW